MMTMNILEWIAKTKNYQSIFEKKGMPRVGYEDYTVYNVVQQQGTKFQMII